MPNPDNPNWTMRRTAVFSLLMLCCAVVVYVVGWGEDNDLHRTALIWAFGSATVLVMGYAGIASLEDVKLASILGKR